MHIPDSDHWIALFDAPFDDAVADAYLRDTRAGGLCLFHGTTRQWTDDKETVELSYEAFEPMAVKEMTRLVDEACDQWPLIRVVFWHRLDIVPVKESSVLIGVASAHRGPAFDACRYLIDRLKVQVPIWKKEHFADGSTEWVQGKSLPEP